jgi:high-affinity iron transporter
VLGAAIVAGFTGEIASSLNGLGQEIFDAGVLFGAVVMLGWHNVWMKRHGGELAAEANSVTRRVRAGARPLYALAVVVGLAVLREGSELVLFIYGLVAAQGGSVAAVAGGTALGIVAGSALGALIYLGLVSVPMRHLFAVTSGLILLLAAGMASQGAAFLLQADLVPALGDQVWDTSAVLTEQSIPGQLLHALTGYVARPAGIQLLFYAATLLLIGGLMRHFRRREPVRRPGAQPAR